MAARAQAGLLLELPERAGGHRARRPRASPSRTATGPGRIRPGARRRSRISGRAGCQVAAEDPAVDEVRSERSSVAPPRRAARGSARGASGRGPRRTAATRRSAAGRPAGGSSGHGSVSWPSTARAARSTIRWLWAILRTSVSRSASGAPGIPWTTAGASAGQRPPAASERGQAQPDARLAGVPDALGDVPVALAAGRSKDRLRAAVSTSAASASAIVASCGTRVAVLPGPARWRTWRRTVSSSPASMPRHAATTSGAPGSRASTHASLTAGAGRRRGRSGSRG